MNDNFNLIAQSRYYLKRFNALLSELKKVDEGEQTYALRELALLIQESIEMCIKGLVEVLIGIDYKHTHLLVDNTLLIRNNSDNIKNFDDLKEILDRIDSKAPRITEFHTKAVYVNSFATSEVELIECKKLIEELQKWIDNNLNI